MARRPRLKGISGVHHVICTGANHIDIFIDKEDKKFFKERFLKYAKELSIIIYAFIIMDNHFHAEIGNASENMPLLMKKLCNSYAYYYNHKYNHTGPVFNGRYKSRPIERFEDFLIVCRYINQNCQKAGICNTNEYTWSSFSMYSKNQLISADPLIDYFTTLENFINFLTEENEDICMEYNSSHDITETSDELYDYFIKQLFSLENCISISRNPPSERNRKIKILLSMNLKPSQISRITGVPKGYIYQQNKI